MRKARFVTHTQDHGPLYEDTTLPAVPGNQAPASPTLHASHSNNRIEIVIAEDKHNRTPQVPKKKDF
jgi:hypothetical protein